MASTQQQIQLVAYGADAMWFILTTVLIVSLQAGFALREYGWVQKKNSTDILYKYLFNGFITVIAWWVLGYGFAYGNTKGGFIGVSKFGLDSGEFDFTSNKAPEYQSFFAEWALAAVAVTIVGGALGERVKLPALVAVAFFVAIWIYPIIVHWTWGLGWLSYRGATVTKYLFYGKDSNNYIDTAGSGIVHAVGGVAALVGAIALGARKGRFDSNTTFKKNSVPLLVVGTLFIWVGYYGFNVIAPQSVLGLSGAISAKIAALTTLSAAFSTLTVLLIQVATGTYDISVLCNGVVAGLVGISASADVIEMWGAMIIGIVSALVYLGASKVVAQLKIDDVVDAFAVHGACGIWGALAVGIFGSDYLASVAGYNGSANGAHPFRTGEQFGVQLVGIICIVAWTFGWSALLFFLLKVTNNLRVPDEKEENGDTEVVEVELVKV